jgi:transposase
LKNPAYRFLDWKPDHCLNGCFSAVAEAGLPVICVETRHMRTALKAQINKTDRNDARGIAQMMRVGLYRPVQPFHRSGPGADSGEKREPVSDINHRNRWIA